MFTEVVRIAAAGATIFVRDLLRPDTEAHLKHLVQTYAGDADDHQQQMFAESLHAALTAEAVVIAAILAIPLAVLAYWYRRLNGPILALSGVLYTIPSLALFALLAPIVGVGGARARAA